MNLVHLFKIYGLEHLAVFITTALLIYLVYIYRHRFTKRMDLIFKVSVVALMVGLEITFLILSYAISGFNADLLPFELCSVIMWVTAYGLIFNKTGIFKVIGPWSVIGTLLAFSFPSMGKTVDYYPVFRHIHFFGLHALFLIANAYMFFTNQVKNYTIKDVHRSALYLLGYALVVGIFDYAFGFNYLFIVSMPPSAEMIHDFIPKPFHVIPGIAFIIGLIYLFSLPLIRLSRRESTYENL